MLTSRGKNLSEVKARPGSDFFKHRSGV
jgi:hypothetical protein